MIKFPPVTKDDVEVRIKQIGEKGAVALLYKTARVDMRMLDETIGPMSWQVDYQTIDGVLFCGISVYNPDTQEWVKKVSNGIESRKDDEGNEKKGEASDAFKRAGFMWGIGRELYTAPFIFFRVPTRKKDKGGYELVERLNPKVSELEVTDGVITRLVIADGGTTLYTYAAKQVTRQDIVNLLIAKYGRDRAQSKLLELTGHERTDTIPEHKMADALAVIKAS